MCFLSPIAICLNEIHLTRWDIGCDYSSLVLETTFGSPRGQMTWCWGKPVVLLGFVRSEDWEPGSCYSTTPGEERVPKTEFTLGKASPHLSVLFHCWL